MQKYLFIPGGLCNKWKILRGYKWGIFTNFCVKKWGTKSLFFPKGSRHIISSHKSLWKCHSHNKVFLFRNIHLFQSGIFHLIYANTCIYLFCRKSSNILEKNLQTWSSVENLCRNLWTNNKKIPRKNKWIFLH